MPEKRRLLLGAGHRYPKRIISAQSERGLGETLEELFDGIIVQNLPTYCGVGGASFAIQVVILQKLKRAGTIPTNRGKKAESINPSGAHSLRNPPAQRIGVGQ